MKFKKTLATLATVGGALSLTLAGTAGTASAATGGSYSYTGTGQIIVGGGSDTTYQAMLAISNLYDAAAINGYGCASSQNPSSGGSPALNQCTSTAQPTSVNANYERDTVAQASPTGSSSGIASLNGDANISGTDTPGTYPYAGTGGTVSFARSSRGPKSTGGNCQGGNELTCDTFWGFAEDGVEVFGFGTHGGINLTPQQLTAIWSCQDTTWGQVTGNTSDTAPIVPWGMNSASGTYATFNNYLISSGGAPTGFTVDQDLTTSPYAPTQGHCVRQLSTNVPPFENDVKPLFADTQANSTGGLTTNGGVNDPDNWIWFGSFGLLSAFPYDNTYTNSSVSFTGTPDSISGTFPSTSAVFGQTYPITRTLYHVTTKAAADCPTNSSNACDFTDNPGPSVTGSSGSAVSDLNVVGSGTTASQAAVREFTRFLCRASGSQDPVDPYTGTNLFTEVTAAKAASGFTPVPTTLRTAGSSCQVQH